MILGRSAAATTAAFSNPCASPPNPRGEVTVVCVSGVSTDMGLTTVTGVDVVILMPPGDVLVPAGMLAVLVYVVVVVPLLLLLLPAG